MMMMLFISASFLCLSSFFDLKMEFLLFNKNSQNIIWALRGDIFINAISFDLRSMGARCRSHQILWFVVICVCALRMLALCRVYESLALHWWQATGHHRCTSKLWRRQYLYITPCAHWDGRDGRDGHSTNIVRSGIKKDSWVDACIFNVRQ